MSVLPSALVAALSNAGFHLAEGREFDRAAQAGSGSSRHTFPRQRALAAPFPPPWGPVVPNSTLEPLLPSVGDRDTSNHVLHEGIVGVLQNR